MLDFAQSEPEKSKQSEITASSAAALPLRGNPANEALQTLERSVPFEQFGLVAFDPDSFAWWSGNEYT